MTALGTFEQISALLNSSHCLPTDRVLPDDEHKAHIRNSNKRLRIRAYTYARPLENALGTFATAWCVGRGWNGTVVSSACASGVTIFPSLSFIFLWVCNKRMLASLSSFFSIYLIKSRIIHFYLSINVNNLLQLIFIIIIKVLYHFYRHLL